MKKMRKIIPALAMLMVAAIMMSTASFAWFTMNEAVTATGMQVKAKAAGNLLISTEKMTALDQAISVSFTNGKKDLTPVTYNSTSKTWQIPGNGSTVNTLTGKYDGTMTEVTAGDNQYFAEYTVYLATAGDEMTGDLYLDLAAIAGIDQSIAPAYSVAVWVGDNTAEPDAVYNYKAYLAAEGGAEGAKLVKTGVTFPSTFEKNTETKVGLKVVIRVYVDGALEDPNKVNVVTNNIVAIEAGTTYASFKNVNPGYANYKFYKDGVEEDDFNWADDKVLTGYTYWDGTSTTTTATTVNYVNNYTIPSASTTFEAIFSAKNTTVANNG